MRVYPLEFGEGPRGRAPHKEAPADDLPGQDSGLGTDDGPGLDPREYTSGTSVHKKVRISKAGNKHLRRALYMPALVAVQHQDHVRAYYDHLLARGKTKMQALVATMRKLLHAIYGMFKHDQLFDGQKLYALTSATLAPALSNSEVVCSQT